MRIIKEESVGLVIDMQERLFPVMVEKEILLKNAEILLNGLSELKVEILATQQYTKGLGETLLPIKNAISDFTFIEKTDFSCLGEPDFVTALKKTGAQNVIICGIEAHVCVLQTAVDLKEAGFNPIVVTDCISSRTKENIEVAKERFRHEKIMMTSYESILFELTRSAKTPEFKSISKLVK